VGVLMHVCVCSCVCMCVRLREQERVCVCVCVCVCVRARVFMYACVLMCACVCMFEYTCRKQDAGTNASFLSMQHTLQHLLRTPAGSKMQGRAKVIVSKTNVNFVVRQKPNVIEITRVRIFIHLSGIVRGRVLEASAVRAQHSLYKLGVAHVEVMAYGIVKGRAAKAISELDVGSVFQEIAHDMHMTLTRAQVEPCAIVIVALVGPHSVCNEALDLVEIALECCLAHEHT